MYSQSLNHESRFGYWIKFRIHEISAKFSKCKLPLANFKINSIFNSKVQSNFLPKEVQTSIYFDLRLTTITLQEARAKRRKRTINKNKLNQVLFLQISFMNSINGPTFYIESDWEDCLRYFIHYFVLQTIQVEVLMNVFLRLCLQ